MPLYDFTCENGHILERIVSRETEQMDCSCGKPAIRKSVYRVGVSGFARPPLDQREVKMKDFNEASAELEHQHGRQTNVDGSQRPEPPLWQTAKRKARRLQKMGVKDSLDLK